MSQAANDAQYVISASSSVQDTSAKNALRKAGEAIASLVREVQTLKNEIESLKRNR